MKEFPCQNCLVSAACSSRCYQVFEFLNNAADMLTRDGTTIDEIHEYRTTAPPEVLHIVDELVRENERFAYPQNIQSHWDVTIKKNKNRGAGSE